MCGPHVAPKLHVVRPGLENCPAEILKAICTADYTPVPNNVCSVLLSTLKSRLSLHFNEGYLGGKSAVNNRP